MGARTGAAAVLVLTMLLLLRRTAAFAPPRSASASSRSRLAAARGGRIRRAAGPLLAYQQQRGFHVMEDLSDKPHPNDGSSFYVLDGTSMLYKAYYSKMELEDYDPEHERPLILLGNDLARLVREHQPTHLVGCFDYVGTRDDNIRRDIYPPYKANRDDTPAAMATLVPQAMRMFEALGVPVFQAPRHESDDVMAALVEWAKEQHYAGTTGGGGTGETMRVVIVSDDKDMLVCAADDGGGCQVHVLNPRVREIYGPQEVLKKTGVHPHQFTCFQALTGDSADGVPGVAGVGPKTAAGLLKAFGSLEGIYENLDKVAELSIRGAKTLGAKLEKQRDVAFLCREVVRLRTEVHLPGLDRLALDDLRFGGPPDDAELLLQEATGGLGMGALQALRSVERGSAVRQNVPF